MVWHKGIAAPRTSKVGAVREAKIEVELEGSPGIVALTRTEWRQLMDLTKSEIPSGYLLSPEYRALPEAVRKVVKNWLRHTLSRSQRWAAE